MADNFISIYNRLLNRAPAVGVLLAQDLVRDSFQQLQSRREWSWLVKRSSWYPSVYYSTGTISIVPGGFLVTGSGTAWDTTFVGTQIRGGLPPTNLPTYTIVAVLSPTSLLLDSPWVGPSLAGSNYQIFQCYFPTPSDFVSFVSLISVTNNYQLHTNVSQATLDLVDAQRVYLAGNSYAASYYDTTTILQGQVGDSIQVSGTGPVPVATTSYGYSGPQSTLAIVTISTGGAPGGALEFTWSFANGQTSLPISVPDESAQDLALGVQVYFPLATYTLGDVFVIPLSAGTSMGVPRYELWPRPVNTPYVYPFLYRAQLPELSDEAPGLPPQVALRGDVLLEMALANCARTPGTAEKPNPYFNLGAALQHDARAERGLTSLELRDDETAIKDLTFGSSGYAPAPWLDGSFLQSHGWVGYPALI